MANILQGITFVEVLEDSIDIHNQRITTLLLHFPKIVGIEFNTHRSISKNASSARAIPFDKMVQTINNSCYIPYDVRHNEKGMQGFTELNEIELEEFQELYENLYKVVRDSTININSKLKIHKQHINKILEPYMYIDMVATSTDWESFLKLRNHPEAHPEMQILAKLIQERLNSSVPNLLKAGEHHLPFITKKERQENTIENLIKASVSRNARTSYKNFDGIHLDIPEDIKLYYKLVTSEPIHASPLEHIAVCTELKYCEYWDKYKHYHVVNKFFNLRGWKSFRFMYEVEGIRI